MGRLISVIAFLATAVIAAQAQPFPSRAITIVVLLPPGGATDTLALREHRTPAGFATIHKAEIDRRWPVIKAAGINA